MNILRYTPHVALLIGFCLTWAAASTARAGTFACGLLKKYENRVYLPYGEEVLIMPGARFSIVCGGDTAATGTIEWSHPGVAISHPIVGLSAMNECASETVLVAIPDVDISSDIIVIIEQRIPLLYLIHDSPPNPFIRNYLGSTAAGNGVWKANQKADRSGSPIEGSIYFAPSVPESANERQFVIDAPFVAVLLPNLSRQINAQGFLTTSAYYRFGNIHLPYLLSGASTKRHDRFDQHDSASSRLYPFAPERGRGLLGEIPNLPESLHIACSEGLKDAANFFADVFSRDRLKVRVTDYDSTADFFLKWVPYLASDPVVGPRTVLEHLTTNEAGSEIQREALLLVEQYLKLAETSQSDEARDYYLNLVDRSLKEDIGAFPLFRPSLAFEPSNRLRNMRVDTDGRLLVSELVLLTTPNAFGEGGHQ